MTTLSELIAGVFASRLGGQPLDLVVALAATRKHLDGRGRWGYLAKGHLALEPANDVGKVRGAIE